MTVYDKSDKNDTGIPTDRHQKDRQTCPLKEFS